MSNIITAIRKIIAESPAVIAQAGNRVCVDFIPEESDMPAMLLYVANETASDCFDGFVGFETARIRIECYGETRAQADELHKSARESLNGVVGVHGDVMIKGIGQNTGRAYLVDKPNDGTDQWLFRTIQTFEVSYNSF